MIRSSRRVGQSLAVGLALLAASAPRAARATTSCSSVPTLKYYGGPVIQNAKIYHVNWGANVSSTISTTLPTFYAALVASRYLDWLSEYNTVGLDGQDGQAGSNQGISRGHFAGSGHDHARACARARRPAPSPTRRSRTSSPPRSRPPGVDPAPTSAATARTTPSTCSTFRPR